LDGIVKGEKDNNKQKEGREIEYEEDKADYDVVLGHGDAYVGQSYGAGKQGAGPNH
jgi:hypothetical protein